MKKILKRWLTSLLGLDRLTSVVNSHANNLISLNSVTHSLDKRLTEQEKLMAHTRSLIHVGMDISAPGRGHDQSWCIVMVKRPDGQADIVQQFEFKYQDYRELERILRSFAGTKTAFDLPYPAKRRWNGDRFV